MMDLNLLVKDIIIIVEKNIINMIDINHQNRHIQVIKILNQKKQHHLKYQLIKKKKELLLLMGLVILKENQWLIKLIMEFQCQQLLI